jgi:hypothetical protein
MLPLVLGSVLYGSTNPSLGNGMSRRPSSSYFDPIGVVLFFGSWMGITLS